MTLSIKKNNNHCKLTLVFTILINLLLVTPAQAEGTEFISDYFQTLSEKTQGRINLSGYVNAHYMKHDGLVVLNEHDFNKSIIEIREASIYLDSIISNGLLFSSELELSYDLSGQAVLGDEKRFDSNITYYYADIDLNVLADLGSDNLGQFNFRVGRILVPFLKYNENKPNFKQNLMSQSFTAWQLSPVNNTPNHPHDIGWTDFVLLFNWKKI